MPISPNVHTFTPSLARRCGRCDAYVSGFDRTCLACGEAVTRPPLRCPRCLGIAHIDEAGDIACRGGCPALPPPPRKHLDTSVLLPRRDPEYSAPGPGECARALPYAGWELVLRELLGTDQHAADQAGDWGHQNMLTSAWDDYGDPHTTAGRGGSLLAVTWGKPDDKGEERYSAAGAALMAIRDGNAARRVEIDAAMRTFGKAVQEAPSPRRGAAGEALIPCVMGAALEDWHRDPAASDAFDAALEGHSHPRAHGRCQMRAALAAVVPEVRELAREMALTAFWSDAGCVSEMARTVGAALCIELHRCLVLRGGTFAVTTQDGRTEGIDEFLHQVGTVRTTPFSGMRHALSFWAGDHGSTQIGVSNPYASLGGAEAKYATRRGVVFGEMAVHASRSSSGSARNVGTLQLLDDVTRCVAAARIGGTWAIPDPAKPEAKACVGGRELRKWEHDLMVYCLLGAEVEPRESRRLTVVEAVDRIRTEHAAAARNRQRGAAQEQTDGRHLTVEQAKAVMPKIRRAMLDALVAWDLIELRKDPPRKKRHEDAPAPQDIEQKAPAGAPAHAAWDVEVA